MEGPMRTTIIPPTTIRTSGDASAGDWRHRAACRDEDPELFFPVGTGPAALLQISEAKAVCRRCPVASACLTWAIQSGIDHGVFGAMSEHERRARHAATIQPTSNTRKPATNGATSTVDVDEVAHWRGLGVSDAAIAVQLETLRKAMRRADEREAS